MFSESQKGNDTQGPYRAKTGNREKNDFSVVGIALASDRSQHPIKPRTQSKASSILVPGGFVRLVRLASWVSCGGGSES